MGTTPEHVAAPREQVILFGVRKVALIEIKAPPGFGGAKGPGASLNKAGRSH
jgi:hypothetical protein